MLTVAEKDIKNFSDLFKRAKREPVRVNRDDRSAFVVVAAEDFQTEEERRREAGKKLMAEIKSLSREAEASGLTDEVLQQVLDEEN